MTGKLLFKIVFKRLFLILGIVFLLGLILGIIYQKDVKEWILDEIQLYISEIQSGDLEIEEIELALFHNLPDVSVRLKNVNYYEHKDTLRTAGEIPILYAETLNLSFEPWQLIRNQDLIVSSVGIVHGSINFIEYDDNKLNLQKALQRTVLNPKNSAKRDTISKKKPQKALTTIPVPKKTDQTTKSKATPNSFEIDIKDIQLREMVFTYHNPSEEQSIKIDLTILNGNIVLNPKGISCNLSSDFQIIENTSLPVSTDIGPVTLKLNYDFLEAEQKVLVNNGYLEIEGFIIDLKGSYDHKKGRDIDLEFNASANDFAVLSRVLQEEVLKQNEALLQKADIKVNGKLSGPMEYKPPIIDLDFGVKNLSFKVPDGLGSFKNIGFTGEFHSGTMEDYSKAMLSIMDLEGQIPGGYVSGNFYVKNFEKPYVKSNVNVSLVLDGYDDIFKLTDIDSLKGKISLTSDFDGLLNLEDKEKMDSIGSWSLDVEDIGFKYIPSKKTISKLNGTISESRNEVTLNNLSIAYDSSNMRINGRLKNLYHYIFNNEEKIEADLEIMSSQWYTSDFILNSNSTALIDDRISDLEVKIKVTARDDRAFDSYFPTLEAEITHMSFELDKLPGLSEFHGLVQLDDIGTGLSLNLEEIHAEFPRGFMDISGKVELPSNFRTLDVNGKLKINELPLEYALDLINEMKDQDLLNAKNISDDKLNIVNGNLNLAGVIETNPFALRDGVITNSDIYLGRSDSVLYELDNLNLKLDSLNFYHYPGSHRIKGIKSVNGEIKIDTIHTPSIKQIPIDLNFKGANDLFNIEFTALRNLKNMDKGSLVLDITKSPPLFELSYDMEEISAASVMENYTSEKVMEGTLKASLQFSGRGTNWEEISSNLMGNINISGDSLVFYGIDMDDLLQKYQSSQKFNLSDVTAFVLAGPMGAVVTKGGDFTRLITANLKPEDSTHISMALSQWSIDQGVLQTEDVAFSTSYNRLAIEGKLDFINDTIPGFTVYVVDKKGCSLMEQRVYGKLNDIKTSKLKVAKTLMGSVINFVNAVVGKKCKPVYQGAVQHPIPKK